MDGLERKKIMDAMKARADEALAERKKKEAGKQKQFVIELEGKKELAMRLHTLKVLENPHLKPLSTSNNRPGEKMALKARGIRKKGRTSGVGGPGI